jgi:ADP-heptose:LPS heptosyltransferase
MIRLCKILTKKVLFYFINVIVFAKQDINKKSLLIIRLDAIGDYILFRNYIEQIKTSEKYQDYTITLVGNIAWKSLSEALDDDLISKYIWLDRDKFAHDFIYRYKRLREITRLGYEVVLNSAYSREFYFGDAIVNLVQADEKVGDNGDLSRITPPQKNVSDRYYDRLIATADELLFEFERSRSFFEQFLGQKIDLKKPSIRLKPMTLPYPLPQQYAVLFIGASEAYRQWDINKFAQIAHYLKHTYHYDIVLCGGPGDRQLADDFSRRAQCDYIDLVGKTSLLEFLYTIANARILVSNETSAPHLAIALDIDHIFVISNGNHYGRFTPYPKTITENYHVIYHPEIENKADDAQWLGRQFGFGSTLDINAITVDSVKHKIANIIRG